MVDSRAGETLWSEWSGEGYAPKGFPKSVFYTEEHVDLDNEIVKRALASSIQRSGFTDSLGQAYKIIENTEAYLTYAGYLDGELDYTICDLDGETFYGDVLDEIVPLTVVEINEL
jgi:hypothetical protein